MFYSTLLLAAAAFTGFVSAQNYSTSGPISIVPDSVPADQRLAWCQAQTTSCPQICGGVASNNQCNPDTLNYTCTCANGNQPNISAYDQTIPAYECRQWVIDCVAAHPNDLTGITACRSVICGSLNASANAASGSSSSSAAASSATGGASASASGSKPASSGSMTASATGSSTASGSASSASPTKSSAAVAVAVAKDYGTGILAMGLLGLFGLAL